MTYGYNLIVELIEAVSGIKLNMFVALSLWPSLQSTEH
jgi:hypothetical protein